MSIEYISGDLFVNRHNAEALAHGCNCTGAMGAGIAVGFRERYPEMYEEYRRRCKAQPRQFNPGDVFLWKEQDKPCVFNLATQENTWTNRATYAALEQTLTAMRQQADAKNIQSIAIARIGAGYGGLSWEQVRPIIELAFRNWSGVLYVYDEYTPETR